MLVGYARTSTLEQEAGLDAQIRDLTALGCRKLFREQVSSVGRRTQLEAAIDFCREGDDLVVTKLDRLARSVTHLGTIITALEAKGVALRILNLGVDSATPTGRLMLNVLGGVAQFEREIMLERQREGIAKAKEAGRYKGRKPTVRARQAEIEALAAERGSAWRRLPRALASVRAAFTEPSANGRWKPTRRADCCWPTMRDRVGSRSEPMPTPSAMPISQHQLAAAVLAADHIDDRRAIAAFVADAATQPAPNPFPNTSAGAVRQVWQQRVVEFQSFGIQVAGLACLLTSLSGMSVDEPLVQEILRAGPHTTNVFSHGDGSRIVGAVLYGKPGFALPALPVPRSLHRTSSCRTRIPAGQLDLFADAGV